MNTQSVELLTFFFLVGVFALFEIHQLFNRKRGIIVAFVEPPVPLASLISTMALVRVGDGTVVEARLSACTQCMARFKIGDEVHLIPSQGGYAVKIPFAISRKHRLCAGGHPEDLFER